jgi:hypothetical protein
MLSSLSLPLFGVIVVAVAAIVAVVAVVLVAPATTTLAAFFVALAVVTTMFLTIDVGSMCDCCLLSPPEEDHRLPPPSEKVPSWPSLPSFVDCRRRRRTTSPLPHHSFTSAASWLIVVYPCRWRRIIVSLLPWGRFRHGPRHPPLLIVAAGGGRRLPSPATASPRQLHGLIPYLLVFPPSHRKESHTKFGIKLLKFAIQIFWRVKIA